jgi:hypothetical protein
MCGNIERAFDMMAHPAAPVDKPKPAVDDPPRGGGQGPRERGQARREGALSVDGRNQRFHKMLRCEATSDH